MPGGKEVVCYGEDFLCRLRGTTDGPCGSEEDSSGESPLPVDRNDEPDSLTLGMIARLTDGTFLVPRGSSWSRHVDVEVGLVRGSDDRSEGSVASRRRSVASFSFDGSTLGSSEDGQNTVGDVSDGDDSQDPGADGSSNSTSGLAAGEGVEEESLHGDDEHLFAFGDAGSVASMDDDQPGDVPSLAAVLTDEDVRAAADEDRITGIPEEMNLQLFAAVAHCDSENWLRFLFLPDCLLYVLRRRTGVNTLGKDHLHKIFLRLGVGLTKIQLRTAQVHNRLIIECMMDIIKEMGENSKFRSAVYLKRNVVRYCLCMGVGISLASLSLRYCYTKCDSFVTMGQSIASINDSYRHFEAHAGWNVGSVGRCVMEVRTKATSVKLLLYLHMVVHERRAGEMMSRRLHVYHLLRLQMPGELMVEDLKSKGHLNEDELLEFCDCFDSEHATLVALRGGDQLKEAEYLHMPETAAEFEKQVVLFIHQLAVVYRQELARNKHRDPGGDSSPGDGDDGADGDVNGDDGGSNGNGGDGSGGSCVIERGGCDESGSTGAAGTGNENTVGGAGVVPMVERRDSGNMEVDEEFNVEKAKGDMIERWFGGQWTGPGRSQCTLREKVSRLDALGGAISALRDPSDDELNEYLQEMYSNVLAQYLQEH